MTALLVALGAGVGVPVRFVLAEWLDEDYPIGTLVANVLASGLLGLCTGMAVSESVAALLGTGFCGGMSTYSAFALQTHRVGLVHAVWTIGLSLTACAVGFWAGQA